MFIVVGHEDVVDDEGEDLLTQTCLQQRASGLGVRREQPRQKTERERRGVSKEILTLYTL